MLSIFLRENWHELIFSWGHKILFNTCVNDQGFLSLVWIFIIAPKDFFLTSHINLRRAIRFIWAKSLTENFLLVLSFHFLLYALDNVPRFLLSKISCINEVFFVFEKLFRHFVMGLKWINQKQYKTRIQAFLRNLIVLV